MENILFLSKNLIKFKHIINSIQQHLRVAEDIQLLDGGVLFYAIEKCWNNGTFLFYTKS